MKDSIFPTGNTGKWVKYGIIILVIIIVVVVFFQVYKASKLAATAGGEIIGGEIIAAQTGVQAPRQRVCKEIAVDIEKAVTRVPLIGNIVWVTDSKVVSALNRCVQPNEAVLVSSFYRELTGDSLKQDIVESTWFVEENRRKITYRNQLT